MLAGFYFELTMIIAAQELHGFGNILGRIDYEFAKMCLRFYANCGSDVRQDCRRMSLGFENDVTYDCIKMLRTCYQDAVTSLGVEYDVSRIQLGVRDDYRCLGIAMIMFAELP